MKETQYTPDTPTPEHISCPGCTGKTIMAFKKEVRRTQHGVWLHDPDTGYVHKPALCLDYVFHEALYNAR